MLIKFQKLAQVVNNLPLKLLLRNDFTNPYGGNINYGNNTVTLIVLNSFFFNFNVNVRTLPCIRKVKATRKIILFPGQRAYFPVKCKLLPTNRSFTFEAKYAVTINVIVNAKLPKVVIVLNTTKGTLIIAKNTVIGYIRKSTNSGYFVTT